MAYSSSKQVKICQNMQYIMTMYVLFVYIKCKLMTLWVKGESLNDTNTQALDSH
jgi:hypothetical protein